MLRVTDTQDREQLHDQWSSVRIVDRDLHACAPIQAPADSKFLSGAGVTAVFAFLVGTGGLLTALYISERDDRGYRFNAVEYKSRHLQANSRVMTVRTPLQNLTHIRETFDAPRTQLASYLGVSRQSVYNWQSGEPIAEHNERVLEQMALAADVLAAGGLIGRNRDLKRSISGGKSLFDLVRAGASGESTAQSLLAIIANESVQRERLTARLRNRKKQPVDLDEFGSPRLDERV
jgi:DNA-binding XRE family transcriptional regulator